MSKVDTPLVVFGFADSFSYLYCKKCGDPLPCDCDESEVDTSALSDPSIDVDFYPERETVIRTHKTECRNAQKMLADYYTLHPNQCKRCSGFGILYWTDWKSGYSDYDFCSCLEKSLCPHCGERLIDQGQASDACPFDDINDVPACKCGWHSKANYAPPQPYQCTCFQQNYS